MWKKIGKKTQKKSEVLNKREGKVEVGEGRIEKENTEEFCGFK